MIEPRRYVLVVDDIVDQREIYRVVLQHAGFRVLQADCGETAVRVAQAHTPDVVVVDLRLPDISGCDVIRRLKADWRTAAIRFVVVTAAWSPESRQLAEAAGCDAFLTKPVTPSTMLDVVRRLSQRAAAS